MSKKLLEDILEDPTKYYNEEELKKLVKRINYKLYIEKKQEKKKDNEEVEYVFTDGSCINNGKKKSIGGYGVYFGENDNRNISKRFSSEEKVTNNKAELKAISEAIKLFNKNQSYVIVSDSMYSIKSITMWSKNWIKNNWKTSSGTEVKNKELIKEILKNMEGKDIIFQHVKSHKKPPKDKNSKEYFYWKGNDIVDKMANNV